MDRRFRSSSYVPSEVERLQLKTVLDEREADRGNYDREIATLWEKLEGLEAGRQAAEADIACCQSALSAQRMLPVELLKEIFSFFCLEVHRYTLNINFGSESPYGRPVVETPTITLSQVCSAWRQIIYSCPALWASVCVELDSLPCEVAAPLSLHLKNRRNYPPTIAIISFDSDIKFPYSARMENAWFVLSKHIPRCRAFIANVTHFHFPKLLRLSFPNLVAYREEHVYEEDALVQNAPWLLKALCDKAPKLVEATLWNVYPRLPYTQLKSLAFCELYGSHQMNRLLELLPKCSVLESLTFWGLEHDHWGSGYRNAEIPRVRRFSIYETTGLENNSRGCLLETLLTSLKLPVLRVFELQCQGWPSRLVDFAENLPPSVEELNIRIRTSVDIDLADSHPLFETLHALPNLTHLELKLAWHENLRSKTCAERSGLILSNLLSKLRVEPGTAASDSPPVFLSRLESLSIWLEDVVLDAQTVEHVLEVVSSRRTALPPALTHRLVSFRLSHFLPGQDPSVTTLSEPLVRRIWEAERELGVTIVIGGTSCSS
ncbi:hypothetical protein AAF712_006286 [Marasmius tenuissimus]|uniref:F-box domain-containing protein n=1 Tax=Marasmius tenuissimus TaxID=585030 RepID=A0ABR2ZZ78_9AGAR